MRPCESVNVERVSVWNEIGMPVSSGGAVHFLSWYHGKARPLLLALVLILFPYYVLKLFGLLHPVFVVAVLCIIWNLAGPDGLAAVVGDLLCTSRVSALEPLRAWLRSPLLGFDLALVYMSCLCLVSFDDQLKLGWAYTGTISRERMERGPLEAVGMYFMLGVYIAAQLPKLPLELPAWRWRRRRFWALLLLRTAQVCGQADAPFDLFLIWSQLVLLPIAVGYWLAQQTAWIVGEVWEENRRLRRLAADAEDHSMQLEGARREELSLTVLRRAHANAQRKGRFQPAATPVITEAAEYEECG